MKYRGIIFDLDGVICSTDHYHYLAWKALADRLGAYFDEEINNRLRGVSRMASLEIVLERYDGVLSQEEKEAAAEEKNNYYENADCLVVEDAEAGVQAAIAAGMDSAAIGDAAKGELATYRLSTFRDLLEYI